MGELPSPDLRIIAHPLRERERRRYEPKRTQTYAAVVRVPTVSGHPQYPLEDYALFHRLAVETRDVDPTYPVIRHVQSSASSTEARLWLTFLHVAYYHLGSALRVWSLVPTPGAVPGDLFKLPCATERRGHRDPRRLERHLLSLLEKAEQHGSLSSWLSDRLPNDPCRAWDVLTERIMSVWGNGRWAAYKTCELLWKVNGLPLRAYDMGHAHSSGPRQGLGLLYAGLPAGNSKRDVEQLDGLSQILIDKLSGLGLAAAVEEVETTLCDFHALADGRYYVGHDIDQMLAQLRAVPGDAIELALTARQHTLPSAYLGELGGWSGVQDNRKRIYRDHRTILQRA